MSEPSAEIAREPWCPRPDQPCASPMCALTAEVTDCVTAVREYADAISIANGDLTLTEYLLDQDLSSEPIHWGSVDSRPTSLHGNEAASFDRTTLDPVKVTCRLCVTLLATGESLSWMDRQGDVWQVCTDGLMRTSETRPFPREYVEKKWGPLRLIETRYRPGVEGQP